MPRRNSPLIESLRLLLRKLNAMIKENLVTPEEAEALLITKLKGLTK